MGKVEWNNTLQLLKIRKRESKSFLYISILLIAMFVFSVVPMIFNSFNDSFTLNYTVMVIYSKIGLILSIIAGIFFTMDYQNYNYKYEIYSSNNKTSFVSYGLFCYILLLKVQIIALLLYVIQYGIFNLLYVLKGNIYFAYEFNRLYLLTGFFLYLLYGFLAISVIIFIGSLNRKYIRIPKILFMVFIVLCTVSFSYIKKYINMADNIVINFIVKESRILIFIIKTVSISLVLIVLSILLNLHSYNNKKERNYGYITLIACIGIFIILRSFSYDTSSITMINEPVVENEVYDYELYKLNRSKEQNEYQINLNELTNGEIIKIYLAEEDKRNFSIQRYNINSKTNDNIIVRFIPNKNNVNKIDVVSYMNPQLDIKCINDEIHFNVLYKENIHVIFLEPYSMLKQFAFFKGKGVLKEFNGNSFGNALGKIILYVPENISIKIVE